MAFTPRIIHADVPGDDDLPLPADLQLLAEQLSEDAARIAACSAAQSAGGIASVDSLPVAHPSHRRWWWRAVAAIAAVAIIGWSVPRALHEGLDQAARQTVSHVDHRSATDGSVLEASAPAALFWQLTAPEREGYLDLLESEAESQGSLSI